MSKLCAFIMAAGLGTRLRPLTNEIPKPLLPVFHKPLMTFALDNLLAAGVEEIACNTRHLAENFYREFSVTEVSKSHGLGNYHQCPLEVFYESEHLDTGGGLRNARSFLERGTFLIHNGDILSDFSLQELITHHRTSGSMATLLLREEGDAKNVFFDEKKNRIVDIRGCFEKKEQGRAFVYTGIAIAEPELLSWITAKDPTSTIDALLDAMKAGQHVAGLVSRSGFWSDLGTPETYLKTHLDIARDGWKKETLLNIHPSSKIDTSAILRGTVIVGAGAHVEHDAELKNCVILPGTRIEPHTKLSHAIISRSAVITTQLFRHVA